MLQLIIINIKKIYRKVLDAAKIKYNIDYFSSAENKSRAAWNFINSTFGNKQKVSRIREFHVGNEVIRDSKDIANHFNKYFINLPLDIQNKHTFPTNITWDRYMKDVAYPTMYLFEVDEIFVYNIVSCLKKYNSTGIDGISASLIKKYISYFIDPYSAISSR